MYPQQPGEQPQGYPATPPQPQQPFGQPQGYQAQPQANNPYQPTPQASVQNNTGVTDPWQLPPQPTPQQTSWQQPQPQQQWQQQQPAYGVPIEPLTPNGIAPIDYLDQIAPKSKASFGFSRKQIAIIGGVVIVGFIGFAIIALTQGGKPNISVLSQQLVARNAATTPVSKEAQQNIKSRELSAINSSLTIQLTNADTGLVNAFTKAGVNVTKISETVTAAESNATIKGKLEEARLNSVFDRVYSREMSYQLATILLQLKTIYETTGNAELKTYLETTYNNLDPLQKQLDAFSASSS
jgi:hypothetical protein